MIMDDVDVYLRNSKLARESESLSTSSINPNFILQYNYWNSPEAIKLFSPRNGESVLSCLSKRINLLTGASYNDTVLNSPFSRCHKYRFNI